MRNSDGWSLYSNSWYFRGFVYTDVFGASNSSRIIILVQMANKKHQRDGGSCVSVRGGEVVEALKLSRNVCGKLPNVLPC